MSEPEHQHPVDDDALAQAKGRALSSPLRMRILRFCLHEAHTNREIAEEFGLNPGSSLHHVRTLVDTGFLEPEAPVRGNRGALQIPYRATGRSWGTPVPGISSVLIRTFVEEVEGVPPDDVNTTRLGLKLGPKALAELNERLHAVLVEFKDRGPDPDGVPISVFTAVHPERRSAATSADGTVPGR